MRYLRTVSTRRLLALIATVIVAIAAGTAIAVASGGNGPVPPRASLAGAIRRALAASPVQGITARITFTNHLIGSSNIQGTDPILTGASGRLWFSPSTHRLRIELQADNGDAQVVINNGSFWVYDPSMNTVYKGTLPAQAGAAHDANARPAHDALPTIATINTYLNRLTQHANLSGAIPSDVGGKAAYTIKVSPKHDGGLLGDAQLAFDAARGVPLRFALYARGDSTPVLELKATNVSFGALPASAFTNAAPPARAQVVKVTTPAGLGGGAADKGGRADRTGKRQGRKHQTQVTGAAAVARRLPFKLVAPSKLVGLPRQSVSLLDWAGKPAALITYGQNLGGIAVIEQAADTTASKAPSTSQGGDHRGLSLPTVSINGATGQELSTALGTILRYTKSGVAFTVIGSVPAAAADAAARAL
jgi:outer membrane lipoprotein-sorting protein